MPKIDCWKERKQFEDERACDSWAAYGQGWEDVTRQVYATTAVGCNIWVQGVAGWCPWGKYRASAGSRSRVGSRSPNEKSSATTTNYREPR